MAALLIVHVKEIRDLEKYEIYKPQAAAAIAQYGGRYLVRGGDTHIVEGNWKPNRLVILEFPTMEQLNAFMKSEEYAPALALRQSIAESDAIAVETLN